MAWCAHGKPATWSSTRRIFRPPLARGREYRLRPSDYSWCVLAAWPSGLGKGLQSPVQRFDSARRLAQLECPASGALAQRESTCSTSKGSLVQSQHAPPETKALSHGADERCADSSAQRNISHMVDRVGRITANLGIHCDPGCPPRRPRAPGGQRRILKILLDENFPLQLYRRSEMRDISGAHHPQRAPRNVGRRDHRAACLRRRPGVSHPRPRVREPSDDSSGQGSSFLEFASNCRSSAVWRSGSRLWGPSSVDRPQDRRNSSLAVLVQPYEVDKHH
jgi:hypothetical protein